MRAAWPVMLSLLAAGTAAGEPVLQLPIDCTLGDTCHIQQFVDRDPGPGARDFRCGRMTYDGHKGTDFAVPTLRDMEAGVDVLAAASGVVVGRRDGMADVVLTPERKADIQGRECGNGVVLRHADGWETQYCHMKSGSITVAKGQQVEQGDVLGQVGLSGSTEFPHVHLSVRHDGEVIDPFDTSETPTCSASVDGLWSDAPDYVPGGLLSAGFSDHIPDYGAVKRGDAAMPELPADAGGLVIFGYAFGGMQGDVIEMDITGPDGPFMSQQVTLDKDQAQFFRATGKRLTADRWPAGRYTGTVRLLRGSTEIDRLDAGTVIR